MSFSSTIKNSGSSPTNIATDVQFLFSSDTVPDADDTVISTLIIPALQGHGSSDLSNLNYVIPKNVLAGRYYLLGVLDKKGVVHESSETNNVAILPLTVNNPNLADLDRAPLTLVPRANAGILYLILRLEH